VWRDKTAPLYLSPATSGRSEKEFTMKFRNVLRRFFVDTWTCIRTAKSWPGNIAVLSFAVIVFVFAFIDIHFGILPH
jgi:hypothetical protein